MEENITSPASPTRVDCPPARDPAVRTFILAAMLVGFGLWCWSDRRETPTNWSDFNKVAAYLMNNYGPFVLLPLGMFFAAKGIVMLRRRLVADAEGIGYVGRETIRWADVTAVDASQLASKGILWLEHKGGKLTLDGWHLQNFKALVAFVEAHVPPGSIKTA